MNATKRPALELLTIQEAAKRLTIPVPSVWGLLAMRRLTPIRLSRRVTRIDADEVVRFVESARLKGAR